VTYEFAQSREVFQFDFPLVCADQTFPLQA
jgi:hypothetical protein